MDIQDNVILSIIIPCYNSFKTLQHGLKRLEEQATPKIEIVIIDDCSSDNSFAELKNLKRQLNLNILLIKNRVNKGPGETRNLGIENSHGKYITFMDADDYFTKDFIEKILYCIKENNPNCIIFDANVVSKRKTRIFPMFQRDFPDGFISTSNALVFIKGATWGKIYLRSNVVNNNVIFLNQMRNEDMPFTKIAIADSTKIYYLKTPLYNYVDNESSLMHDVRLLDCKSAQNAFKKVEQELSDRFPDEVEAIFIVEYLYSTVLTNAKKYKYKEFCRYVIEIEKLYTRYRHNPYFSKMNIKIKVVIFLAHYKLYYLIKLLSLKRT